LHPPNGEDSVTDFTFIRISNVKENDAILNIQIEELREVAQLRRDGAIELIRDESPETTILRTHGDCIKNTQYLKYKRCDSQSTKWRAEGG